MEAAVLFFSLALAVNLAVYGCVGSLGAWSRREVKRNKRLVCLSIAGILTVLAAGARYVLAFAVRPFG